MYTSIYVKSNDLLDYTFKTETRKHKKAGSRKRPFLFKSPQNLNRQKFYLFPD